MSRPTDDDLLRHPPLASLIDHLADPADPAAGWGAAGIITECRVLAAAAAIRRLARRQPRRAARCLLLLDLDDLGPADPSYCWPDKRTGVPEHLRADVLAHSRPVGRDVVDDLHKAVRFASRRGVDVHAHGAFAAALLGPVR